MYRKETITAAYEGAGWVFFPTETYHSIPPLCVHHQGFEIIRCAHFPPTLVSSQLLESSLEPNWLPPMDTMTDEWDWTFGTVKRTRLLIPIIDPFFHRNPAYSASSSLNFTPFMKDLQRDQTMKESNCYTGEHTVTPKSVTITNLKPGREAPRNHPWESRFTLVGPNIVQTLGYKLIPGSRDSAQGPPRYTVSNKTVPITNPNTVREAHCNHMWEFRLALV